MANSLRTPLMVLLFALSFGAALPGYAQHAPKMPQMPAMEDAALDGAPQLESSGRTLPSTPPILGVQQDVEVEAADLKSKTSAPSPEVENGVAKQGVMQSTPSDGAVPLTTSVAPPPQETAEVSQAEATVHTDLEAASQLALKFLRDGGPSIWAIAALSVITLALILWKIWRLALIGAWSRGKAISAVAHYVAEDTDKALATVQNRRGLRSKVVFAAISARESLPEDTAREETARVAKKEIGEASEGLRALELIATIAPLLGLLGTVMGMIAAFQALQESGSRADPSLLAGGIWEALLTTAAGMAVAIPASAALTWFEAVIDRMRRDIEDAAMRIFVTGKGQIVPHQAKLAAE